MPFRITKTYFTTETQRAGKSQLLHIFLSEKSEILAHP